MTATDFRKIALSLEGVEEYSHAGLPAFCVGGRKFASLASQAEGYGNLMLTLEQQSAFVQEAPRFSCPFLAAGEKWDTRTFAWPPRARMYSPVPSEQHGNSELTRTQRQAARTPTNRPAFGHGPRRKSTRQAA